MHPVPPQHQIPIQLTNNGQPFIIPQHPTIIHHPPPPHPPPHNPSHHGPPPPSSSSSDNKHPSDERITHPIHPNNGQQPPPHHPSHPHNRPPPQRLFNPQYASGITHIPVTHVLPPNVQPHGLPPNVVLTPIHPPPPGAQLPPPSNVTFINPSNFNVPPVQTVYSTSNTPPVSVQPPVPSSAEQKSNGSVHRNDNGNTLNSLNNLRQREILPVNPRNPLYANSQHMARANPHQSIPPHVRNTLTAQQPPVHDTGDVHMNDRSKANNNNSVLPQIPALQPLNKPKPGPFGHAAFHEQTKKIQTWHHKKQKAEERLRAIAVQHGNESGTDSGNSTIGVPRNGHNQQNVTGRAHFVPSHGGYINDNNNNNGHQYSHIGYDPSRYNMAGHNDRKRKREEEALSEVDYSETDEEDVDMQHLYDTTDSSTEDEDNYGGPPKKKKRKKSGHGRNRKTMSKTERKKQYEHYMKQFEGIEHQLDELKPIEPIEDFKKLRKEYIRTLEVEKILHRREYENPDTGLPKYEYYVLYKYLSYIHCEWISEETLLNEKKGGQKIKRFAKQGKHDWIEGVELFDETYTTVDRILSARPGPGFHSGDTRFEYLVKFNGLNYSDCRWEFADDIDDDAAIQEFQHRSLMPQDVWEPKIRPRPNFYKPLTAEMNKFKDNNKLHPWQIEGVNWLTFNWYNRRGGILADEMGLGKTVQVVTTLNRISSIYAKGPFLIVAPLSTVNHWKREIEAWTDLNPVIYQGNKEDRRICHFFEFRYFDNTGRRLIHNELYKFNILITTYESVMLDDELQRIKWKVCVVDEAHRLKNNEAKLSKHLRKCNIEHSILLTGTPIQNNMRELWNLLNFVDGNRFISYKDFEYKYGDDKMKTDQQINDLKSLIKPYFLRRLKEDVAKFIPEKRETIIEVELTRIQKQYYRALLEKNREFLYRGVSTRNAPKLMNIANDLRKICNHPYLISGAYERITSGISEMEDKIDTMINSSGKFILLHKLLPHLQEKGNKVLIFSQWRITLDWIEEYLRQKAFLFERIDGNITGNSRQAAIDRFCNPNSNSFIFLLTTKAGGVGLNLTAADTVIIFDSDWNPQNDIQAMARCHRIGQDQAVTVYRLITSRSYEKEMFIKASKKLGLGQAIMGAVNNGNATTGGLSQKEINQLLKNGAYHVFQDDDKEADQFCAEDIDEILKKRAKDIIFDSKKVDQNGSAFSRATFITSDDAANININDKDFWEKILPKELNPSDMIQTLEENEEELKESKEKKEEFWTHLTQQVEEVCDLRERGMLATQIQTIIKLLTMVANSKIFSSEQRVKAQDWANYIENPRRFRRNNQHKKSFNEDDLFLPSTRHNRIVQIKQTVYKTRQFTPKEIETLTKLFFNTFSTTADNIFEIIHSDFCKSDGYTTPRSLREIAGWCNAFVLYLSTELHDKRDKNAFLDVKHLIKKLMPKDFKDLNSCNPDSDGEGDDLEDVDYSPQTQKKKSKRRRQKKLPKNCQITDFPSLDEKWFTRMINKSSTKWAKRMRLAVQLRQRLKSIRDISKIKIPAHIGGKEPTSWWTSADDKNLLIGAATHGVSNWDNIRKDSTLGFMKKVLTPPDKPSGTFKMNTSSNSNNKRGKDKEDKRKCCGRNIETATDIQCDGCEDFLHGECCGITSPEQITGIWFCFECNGNWPKANILYDRLAAILHAMKKTRYHANNSKKKSDADKSKASNTNSNSKDGKHADTNHKKKEPRTTHHSSHRSSRQSRKSVKEKLQNSRTRIGRMWNFSLKEMHALQRTIQIYGKIAWNELKTKSKSPKTEDQVESYFYSFMSNVEYLIRCERLKELIVAGKIELPLPLQQKFCRPSEVEKRGGFKQLQQRYHSQRSTSETPDGAASTASVISQQSSTTPPNTALPDLIKGECISMVTNMLNDHMVSKHFASFKSHDHPQQQMDDSLTLSDIYRKIEMDQYQDPKQIFSHIQCMIDQKLAKHASNEEIIRCVNTINQSIQQNKQHILINFANERSRYLSRQSSIQSEAPPLAPTAETSTNSLMSNASALGHLSSRMTSAASSSSASLSRQTSDSSLPPPIYPHPVHHPPPPQYINYNRFRIKKTDMDMLSEADVEKYFGLKKPDSIVNHQLTVNLANKVWQRAQMWVHLRKVEEIDSETLTKLYALVKAQRNEPGTNSKLPEWWHPPKHDRLVIRLILRHGMQQTCDLMINDSDFQKEVDVQEHREFLKKFFVPKKPLILRLRYVAYVLTHGGEEPTRDTWHYNSLQEVQSPFFYKPIQSREDYQRDMNEWFEQHEIQTGDSQSPAPSSSIDLGLLSSKSPRRTGKSSELIERYRTLSRDEDGQLIFPIQAKQGASIISLGEVVWDRKLFSSSKYIWPNGFESQRIHPSYLEPSQRVIYTSKIIDAGDRPKFAVIASDDPDNPIIANSASTAWTNVITKVNYAKDPDKRRKTCTVSGPEMFGYNDPLIIALIEELPNSRNVTKYWKNRTPFKEVLQDALAQE